LIIVSPFDEDFVSLLEILKPSDWTVYRSSNHTEASATIGAKSVPVVLCERELPEGDWQQLAAQAQSLPEPPRFIITTLHADERLWVEALNLGAHDLLRKPFDASEVNRVVTYARQSWDVVRKEKKRDAKRAPAPG
jgi:DNA-binding NtrC family response regulator